MQIRRKADSGGASASSSTAGLSRRNSSGAIGGSADIWEKNASTFLSVAACRSRRAAGNP
jgi:hypothetical protein